VVVSVFASQQLFGEGRAVNVDLLHLQAMAAYCRYGVTPRGHNGHSWPQSIGRSVSVVIHTTRPSRQLVLPDNGFLPALLFMLLLTIALSASVCTVATPCTNEDGGA
jgi:hypothetical protein